MNISDTEPILRHSKYVGPKPAIFGLLCVVYFCLNL